MTFTGMLMFIAVLGGIIFTMPLLPLIILNEWCFDEYKEYMGVTARLCLLIFVVVIYIDIYNKLTGG